MLNRGGFVLCVCGLFCSQYSLWVVHEFNLKANGAHNLLSVKQPNKYSVTVNREMTEDHVI